MHVVFLRSRLSTKWDGSIGSILELAEFNGLELKNGCRSGMCGVCAVKVLAGEVEYPRPTLAEPDPGTALLCKAVPKRRVSPGSCVILDC